MTGFLRRTDFVSEIYSLFRIRMQQMAYGSGDDAVG